MKETISTILAVIFMLGLGFLFQGEPSLWDKLHERAMAEVSCGT